MSELIIELQKEIKSISNNLKNQIFQEKIDKKLKDKIAEYKPLKSLESVTSQATAQFSLINELISQFIKTQNKLIEHVHQSKYDQIRKAEFMNILKENYDCNKTNEFNQILIHSFDLSKHLTDLRDDIEGMKEGINDNVNTDNITDCIKSITNLKNAVHAIENKHPDVLKTPSSSPRKYKSDTSQDKLRFKINTSDAKTNSNNVSQNNASQLKAEFIDENNTPSPKKRIQNTEAMHYEILEKLESLRSKFKSNCLMRSETDDSAEVNTPRKPKNFNMLHFDNLSTQKQSNSFYEFKDNNLKTKIIKRQSLSQLETDNTPIAQSSFNKASKPINNQKNDTRSAKKPKFNSNITDSLKGRIDEQKKRKINQLQNQSKYNDDMLDFTPLESVQNNHEIKEIRLSLSHNKMPKEMIKAQKMNFIDKDSVMSKCTLKDKISGKLAMIKGKRLNKFVNSGSQSFRSKQEPFNKDRSILK